MIFAVVKLAVCQLFARLDNQPCGTILLSANNLPIIDIDERPMLSVSHIFAIIFSISMHFVKEVGKPN